MAQNARQRAQSLFSLEHQVGLLSQWIQESTASALADAASPIQAQSWHGAGSLVGAKT
jgi:hypothetical protein